MGDSHLQQKEPLAKWRRTTQFGDRIAYSTGDAHKGESNEGEQKNGKEDLEEGKEDRSDEAVDGSGRQEVSFHCDARRLTLLQERGARALQSFSLEKG